MNYSLEGFLGPSDLNKGKSKTNNYKYETDEVWKIFRIKIKGFKIANILKNNFCYRFGSIAGN